MAEFEIPAAMMQATLAAWHEQVKLGTKAAPEDHIRILLTAALGVCTYDEIVLPAEGGKPERSVWSFSLAEEAS